jgi:hypothetical protein
MLRACVIQYVKSWDKSLAYAKFSYNNSYQGSLKIPPFEMLYSHRCRTPFFWSETGERMFLDLSICKKPGSKFIWLGRTCELRNQGRRATLIIGEQSWALKLEISCTSRCHPWGVCAILRYEASSHRGSLDHSRFWRREVKWLTNWSCYCSCLMYITCSMSLN